MTKISLRQKIRERKSKASEWAFLLFVLEAFSGGFYVIISRGVTPIFLVASGYVLRDLLLLNVFAGLLSLLVALFLYRSMAYRVARRNIKARIIAAMLIERVFWFTIPWGVGGDYLIVLYALALASTIPTGVYLNIAFFTFFDEQRYRRLIAYRTMASSIASIVGQVIMITILAVGEPPWKYITLYTIAFSVGLISIALVSLAPLRRIELRIVRKVEEEAEIHAGNIYLLLVALLASSNLLSISWIPRLMRDLGAPDYLAASIGFIQTITNIFASMFWVRRRIASYRYAIILLATIPVLVSITPLPLAHLGIAMLYSFAFVGANFYAGITYASIVKRLGAPKASILLSSASALAIVLAGLVGYLLVFSTLLVFLAASIFSLIGLTIALIALPELAILPPSYTRLYSRVLYQSSITSYNFVLFTVSETARATLKFTILVVGVIILFVIYRTLYYLVILTGG